MNKTVGKLYFNLTNIFMALIFFFPSLQSAGVLPQFEEAIKGLFFLIAV